MAGLSHFGQKLSRNPRRSNAATVKVEEKRLQSLLNFIDTRMQEQRSKLRRQIEDTQQTADEMEEKRHKATLQVLKNYFEVTSGRVRGSGRLNQIHEERMSGVLSEPSLATVPEIDPEILAKPRSMYDRVTRSLDTSRLPLIAPKHKGLVGQQSVSLPASIPNSDRSLSDESSTPRIVLTPRATPSSTPRNLSSPSDSVEDVYWTEIKKPFPINKEHGTAVQPELMKVNNGIINANVYIAQSPSGGRLSPTRNGQNKPDNGFHHDYYDQLNGHVYQKGALKPTSRLSLTLEDSEPPTPRLGDIVASKRGLTRHSSLKRPMKSSMAMSTMSMSELLPTRKQQAASKLKHALKGGGSLRVPR